MDPIKLYGARCGYRCGNAGDEFSRAIVKALSGRPVYWTGVKEADIVACGSIAQDLPEDFSGIIWGTGLMFEHMRVRTPGARIAALRGKLTAARWEGVEYMALGDPGLLVCDVVDVVRPSSSGPRYEVGIIPHYVDNDASLITEWIRRLDGDDITVIDICQPLPTLLRAMTECRIILSSSLHGLIFADALNIPNAWIVLSDRVQGGSFKFRDYYSVFGINDPVAFDLAVYTTIDDVKHIADRYHRSNIGAITKALRQSFPEELVI